MLPARLAPALAALLLLPGCGLIHFGRLPASAIGDTATAEAYTNLATEHKILKQELALARKEGDALRATIDRAGTLSAPDLAAQLNATTRELAALRASHAKLQAQRPGTAVAGTASQLSEIEEKLATSLRHYTQLQEENVRLRADVERARTENTTLAAQLKTAVARHEQAQADLAQLNLELLAQKEARARADQATAAARGQLTAVLAAAPGAPAGTSTNVSSILELAKAPPAEASPTAELRTSAERLQQTTSTRKHVVAAGDTLEQLAQKYLGSNERWREIYDANETQLSQGRPLTVGMQLAIPKK